MIDAIQSDTLIRQYNTRAKKVRQRSPLMNLETTGQVKAIVHSQHLPKSENALDHGLDFEED